MWKIAGFPNAGTAEGLAMLNTMKLAYECGFRRLVFESDNKKLIHLLQRREEAEKTYLGSIVREIEDMGLHFDKAIVSFSKRKNN